MRQRILRIQTKAQSIQENIDKLDFIKLKNFCSAKDMEKTRKDQVTMDRKYLQITYLIKDLYPQIYIF